MFFRQVANCLQHFYYYLLLPAISYFSPPSTCTPHTSPCTTSTLFAFSGDLQPIPSPIYPSQKLPLSTVSTHFRPFPVQHCYRQPSFGATPYLKSLMGDLNFLNYCFTPTIPSLMTTPFQPNSTSIISMFRAHF